MPRQAQQRFLDLAVGEVSLVDSPANEQVFNVVKSLNQEDGDMADAANTEVTKGDTNVETVPVEVAKATNEAVEKAMAQVTALVENIAKAAGGAEADPAASDEGSETSVSKADGDELPTEADIEKALTKEQKAMRDSWRQKLEKQMEAKGLKGDALKSAVDVAMRTLAGQGAFMPGGNTKPPEKPGMKNTSKNTDGEAGGASEEEVAKAAATQAVVQETIKQITAGLQGAQALSAPEAQTALKSAIETLQNLMKQMTMQQVAPNASPSTTVPTSPMFGGSGVITLTKALEGVKEALSGIQDVTKSLSERVEDIEKTRNPSTSQDGTDGTTTQETKKSFWSGVL